MIQKKEMTKQQATYLNSAGMPNPLEPSRESDMDKLHKGFLTKYTDADMMRWLLEYGYVLQFEKDRIGYYRMYEESKIRYVPAKDITDALVDVCCLVCYEIKDKEKENEEN